MTQQSPFVFVVALLLVAGIATAAMRHMTYRIPFLPGEQQDVWQVEARIEYQARGGPTQLWLTLPPASATTT